MTTPAADPTTMVEQVERAEALPYERFLEERQKILEARSRAQQRVDQLVTGGAAGALVLSITFLEKIAPHPALGTRIILVGAWVLLLVSLGLSLGSHYASCHAFDVYLTAFVNAYKNDSSCTADSPAARFTAMLDRASGGAFVVGVALLAWFAFANVQFTDPRPRESNGSRTTPPVSTKPDAVAPGAIPTPAATTAPVLPRKN